MVQPKADGAMTPMQVTADGRWAGYSGKVTVAYGPSNAPQIESAQPERAWFGPLDPLPPIAPEGTGGRAYDYPFGQNLQYIPKSGFGTPFEVLRALAESLPLLATIIENRKNRIASWDWAVQPKGAGPKGTRAIDAGTQVEIERVTEFLTTPDQRREFHTWLRPLIDDMLVIDAATIYPRFSRGGDLISLEVIDGSTITPLVGGDGRLPLPDDGPAYQQILHGLPAADFYLDELLYLPRNIRSKGLYGYSPVEQVLLAVNIALRRDVYNLEYYRTGSIPDAFGTLPKEWTGDQVRGFQDYFDNQLVGNLMKRRGLKFMPDGFKLQEVRQPPLKDQYDEWLARVICYAFSVPPTPFVNDNARATAQTLQLQAENDGSVPQKAWVKGFMDRIIIGLLGAKDLEFAWVGDDAIDPLEQAQSLSTLVGAGIKTVDEARQDLGLAPLTAQQKAELAQAAPAPANGAPQLDADGNPIPSANPALKPGANAKQPVAGKQPAQDATAAKPGKTKAKPAAGKMVDAAGVAKVGRLPFDAGRLDTLFGKARKAPKGFVRLDPIPFERPATDKAIKGMRALWAPLLMKQGHVAAAKASAILSHKLGKAKTPNPVDGEPQDVNGPGDVGETDLTDAEIAAAAEQVASGLDLDLDTAEMMDLEAYLQSVAMDAGGEALAQVGLGDADASIFEHLNQAALDWAKEHAGELVTQISETTRDAVRDAIVDGIEGNLSTAQIADAIQALGEFDPDRAELIANTEIRFANSQGALEGYKAASDNGVDVLKSWLIADEQEGKAQVCEDCESNADDGPIELDALFSDGSEAPPSHPSCRCRIAPYIRQSTPEDDDNQEDEE